MNDINDRGGVAGRKIELVFYDWQAEHAMGNQDAGAQVACSRWTEDRPVFAVVNAVNIGDNALTACLAKRNTIHIAARNLRPQSRYLSFAPYLISLSWPSIERYAPTWLRRLEAKAFFDGGWDIDPGPGREPTKVGILSTRNLYGPDFSRILRQQLGRLGLEVAETFEWSGEGSRLGDEMGQAVVRFRQAGVTHVITSDQLTSFAVAAESQNYRPRYAVSSRHDPSTAGEVVPAGQLRGAMGIGWVPTIDVNNAQDPGDVSAAETRCRKVQEKAGQSTSSRDAFTLMAGACDGFTFLAEAIERGGLSPQGVQRGAQMMRTWPFANTFRVSFERGPIDGPAAARDIVFGTDCRCFKYTSDKNHGM